MTSPHEQHSSCEERTYPEQNSISNFGLPWRRSMLISTTNWFTLIASCATETRVRPSPQTTDRRSVMVTLAHAHIHPPHLCGVCSAGTPPNKQPHDTHRQGDGRPHAQQEGNEDRDSKADPRCVGGAGARAFALLTTPLSGCGVPDPGALKLCTRVPVVTVCHARQRSIGGGTAGAHVVSVGWRRWDGGIHWEREGHRTAG